MTYKFQWKRRWKWNSLKKVVGHKFTAELDRMDVFQESGSVYSIPKWSECSLKLGTDWVLFTKNNMEEESGQDIKLKVGT